MIEEKRESPVPSEVIWLHIDELIQAGMLEYQVFDMLGGLKLPAGDISEIRKIFIELVELNNTEQLKLGEEIGFTARKLLQRDFQPGTLLFQTWWDCIEAVEPDRKLIRELSTGFNDILDQLKPLRREYIEFLPPLFRNLGSQALEVLPCLSDILTSEVPSEKISEFFGFLTSYLEISSYQLFWTALQIGAVIYAADEKILPLFGEVCSTDLLKESREAQKFVATLGSALEQIPETYRKYLLRLGLILAQRSLSSAIFVLSKINGSLAKLPEEWRTGYLDAFADIISYGDIKLVNFCLGDLLNLFTADPPKAQAAAEIISAVAMKYGPQAAFNFVEKKTAVSKDYFERF